MVGRRGIAMRCCRGAGRTVGPDAGDDGADGNDVIDLVEQFFQDAFGRAGYFGVDLIGSDLEHRLVLFNGIAGLLVPFQDGGFHDTFTHFRHYQIDKRHTLEDFDGLLGRGPVGKGNYFDLFCVRGGLSGVHDEFPQQIQRICCR